MTSRLRLADMPFLAATLAMALTLILPWALSHRDEDGQQAAELASVLPWAVPDPLAGPSRAADPAVQLASQAGGASEDLAQP